MVGRACVSSACSAAVAVRRGSGKAASSARYSRFAMNNNQPSDTPPNTELTKPEQTEKAPARKTFVLRRKAEAEAATANFRIRYADELNATQLAAVEQTEGPVLVIAGAGTGKTRTLVYRVARLIEMGIKPEQILLLTFTRKSAQEMLRRAGALVGARAEQVNGGTFHSFANLTLRKHAQLLNYQSTFTILDQGDCEDVLNLLRARMGFDTKGRRFPRKQTLASMISGSINRMTPIREIIEEDYPQYRRDVEEIEKLARSYQEYKRMHNLMDYDDLLVNMALLLQKQAIMQL